MTTDAYPPAGARSGSSSQLAPPPRIRRRLHGGRHASHLFRQVAAKSAFLAVSIAGILAFLFMTPVIEGPPVGSATWLLRLSAYTLLASFPTWLYVRFLGVKLNAVYTEYVLNLHRLGVDYPYNLPEPLKSSEYHARWANRPDGPGPAPGASETVYDAKFRAYFGRRPDPGQADDPHVGSGSLLPVFVLWAAFSVGWLFVLLDPSFPASASTASAGLADPLRFAFLGAYVFTLQLLVRAYFQNDLRSSSYVGALERLVVVLILVTVIDVIWSLVPEAAGSHALEAGFAFLVGSFPIVGQQWLNQFIAGKMRVHLQSLYARHPLDEIDGMNVWYQARLLEEGIEDVQNLATANLVDVVLHSRAPIGRIVDWVDQSLLLQHLPPLECEGDKLDRSEDDKALRHAIQALGVRSATDLLELYAPLDSDAEAELHHRVTAIWPEAGPSHQEFHRTMLEVLEDPAMAKRVDKRLLAVLRCLGTEPNLQLVLNWQTGMADYQSA